VSNNTFASDGAIGIFTIAVFHECFEHRANPQRSIPCLSKALLVPAMSCW
jgi:hypothetical protein